MAAYDGITAFFSYWSTIPASQVLTLYQKYPYLAGIIVRLRPTNMDDPQGGPCVNETQGAIEAFISCNPGLFVSGEQLKQACVVALQPLTNKLAGEHYSIRSDCHIAPKRILVDIDSQFIAENACAKAALRAWVISNKKLVPQLHRRWGVFTPQEQALLLRSRNINGNTLLMSAVLAGNLHAVKFLISQGASRLTINRWGETVLTLAARNHDPHMLQVLTHAMQPPTAEDQRYIKANARQDSSQDTPLMAQVRLGHLETVETLLAQGADVNAITSAGETALTIALKCVIKAIKDRSPNKAQLIQITQRLLAQPPDFRPHPAVNNALTILHHAKLWHDPVIMQSIFRPMCLHIAVLTQAEQNTLLNEFAMPFWSYLWALPALQIDVINTIQSQCQPELKKTLLSSTDAKGNTPMRRALKENNWNLISALIAPGSPISLPPGEGQALLRKMNEDQKNPLEKAALLKRLLTRSSEEQTQWLNNPGGLVYHSIQLFVNDLSPTSRFLWNQLFSVLDVEQKAAMTDGWPAKNMILHDSGYFRHFNSLQQPLQNTLRQARIDFLESSKPFEEAKQDFVQACLEHLSSARHVEALFIIDLALLCQPEQKTALLNATNAQGQTPMRRAFLEQRWQLMSTLVEADVPLLLEDGEGRALLQSLEASGNLNLESVQPLLRKILDFSPEEQVRCFNVAPPPYENKLPAHFKFHTRSMSATLHKPWRTIRP